MTAKVGKLITSKNIPLIKVNEGFKCTSPIILDLFVPFDKELSKYENKEVINKLCRLELFYHMEVKNQ